MNRITPIIIEWNCNNGFILSLLDFDYGNIEGALIGINASKNFLYISLFWFTIEIFDKTA